MKLVNVMSYVSQAKWKDEDKEVECTVEATVDGVRKKTTFNCVDPLTASELCMKNPDKYVWFSV